MHVQLAALLLAAAASLAAGQQPDGQAAERQFHFEQATTSRQVADTATAIRIIVAGMREVSADGNARTLTVRGPERQIAMADWLVRELGQNGGTQAGTVLREYPAEAADGEPVRVVYLAHLRTPRDMQDAATAVRSTTDLQRIAVYGARWAIAMRGSVEKLDAALWLIRELDQAPESRPAPEATPREYRWTMGVAQVRYLAKPTAAPTLQETATRIRGTAGIQRLFIHSGAGAIVMSGTAEELAAADRIIAGRAGQLAR